MVAVAVAAAVVEEGERAPEEDVGVGACLSFFLSFFVLFVLFVLFALLCFLCFCLSFVGSNVGPR